MRLMRRDGREFMENGSVLDILRSTGFRFNKALGQNFIFDTNLLDAIVADSGVSDTDTVVEVGTGAGTLTSRLAQRAERVVSFEVDRGLRDVLSLTLRGTENAEVVFRDVLKMKDEELAELTGNKTFKVVANLPYYITTPLIMRFIESGLPVASLTVMVQKEVADRLRAERGTADYSALTLAAEMFGDVTLTRTVDRHMFRPAPNVDSAVVRLDRVSDRLAGEDVSLVKRTVRAAFAMRRKTLANNLSSVFGISKTEAGEALAACGLPADIRGERLSLDEFVALTHALFKVGG